ncbi:MAG: hypothetical protein ACPG42_09255 [Alphaproteobacteria bacterium]|jgi:hypothetical protein
MAWDIVSTLVAKPNPGGAMVSLGRMNRGAAIMREHGLQVNIGRVMFGRDFGSLVMYAGSSNYENHLRDMGSTMADPAFMALQAEIAGLPASTFTDGLRVWRNIGEVDPEKYGFTNHRFYAIPGRNVSDALAMLPDVQAMAAEHGIGVNMSVSAFGSPMLLTANYQATSLEAAGKAIDSMATSPEFVKIVSDASKLGALMGASLVGPAM